MGVHIIATEDEKGEYNTFVPENPNVKVHCEDLGEIIPKTAAAKGQDEQIRVKKSAICAICGKKYNGYPAGSRGDNETEICPDCGPIEALDAVGMSEEGTEKILQSIKGHREKYGY